MVSEPNFVLGIKQKSLASKEESHVHITVRSHTYLSAGSKLHSISQPPWLIAVSRSSNRASRDLTYQICAQQAFAWWNQLDRPTSRHIVTKTQEHDHQRQPHEPPRADNGSWNSHMRRRRFSTPSLDLSHMRRQDGLVVHRSTWPENLVVIRRYTLPQAPSGYLSRHHAPVHATTRLLRAEEFMLMSLGDVITPSQQPCKHLHISPSPRQRHVIGWRQRLCCSTRDPTRTSIRWLWTWTRWL